MESHDAIRRGWLNEGRCPCEIRGGPADWLGGKGWKSLAEGPVDPTVLFRLVGYHGGQRWAERREASHPAALP